MRWSSPHIVTNVPPSGTSPKHTKIQGGSEHSAATYQLCLNLCKQPSIRQGMWGHCCGMAGGWRGASIALLAHFPGMDTPIPPK